jgi:hypothetical protein
VVDLNPLHYINKFNHMFGDSAAEALHERSKSARRSERHGALAAGGCEGAG